MSFQALLPPLYMRQKQAPDSGNAFSTPSDQPVLRWKQIDWCWLTLPILLQAYVSVAI